jgi:endogenous inhibitor of DNA gyrase (YacG/DUF329 family)
MTAGRCPICGKPAVTLYRPFCSSRCADVDLNRWLTGAYSIENEDDGQGDDPGSKTDEEA